MTRAGLIAALGVVAACSSSSSSSGPAVETEPASVSFPAPFLWGSATAGFQVEKDLPSTDWGVWVKTPGKIKNGDDPNVNGDDALAHIQDDVALLVATNQNAYRFSIEWTRLYPTRDAFDADQPDPAGISAYDALFDALHAAHITPLVTLQHFALPSYVSDPTHPDDPQGWERSDTGDLFATWCARAAKRWGADVDIWATINEPLVNPVAGYIQGSFPPGEILKVDRALAVGRAEARAHAKCFDAIKANDTVDLDGDGQPSFVGIVHNTPAVEPDDPTDDDSIAAAARVKYVNNTWILNAVVKGDWDDDFDGTYDGPNDKRADPTLINRVDYLGINYYTAIMAGVNGLDLPIINATIRQTDLPTDRPKTDFHWDIYAKGFRIALDDAAAFGKPIIVTENGIADSQDANRTRFLYEHLFELGHAKADGLDIRGYFYWSLLDNFEWASGFCPKFGLSTVSRTARASAQTYANIIKSGVVNKADRDAQPAYVPPVYCN